MAAGVLVRGEFRPGGVEREWCDPEVLRMLRRRSLAQAASGGRTGRTAGARPLPASVAGSGHVARRRRPAARGHRPAGGAGVAGERPGAGHPAGAGRAIRLPDARRAAGVGRGRLGRRRVARPRRRPGPAVARRPARLRLGSGWRQRRPRRRHPSKGGWGRRSWATWPTGARRSIARSWRPSCGPRRTSGRPPADPAGAARCALGPGLVRRADQRHVPAHPRAALAEVGTRPAGRPSPDGCLGTSRSAGGCRSLVAGVGGHRDRGRHRGRHATLGYASDDMRSRCDSSIATGC